MRLSQAIVWAALVFVPANSSWAAPLWSTGNQSMNENVLFGHSTCAGCVDGPATTVIGHGQTTNILVDFSSLTSIQQNGGNAVWSTNEAAGFMSMSIFSPGYYITGIMFQLTEVTSAPDGNVALTANLAGGGTSTGNFALSHTGGGQNQFYWTGGSATSIGIAPTQALHDVSQISITLQAVPEPATFGMVGAGLVALAVMGRRVRR